MSKEAVTGLPRGVTYKQYRQMFNQDPVSYNEQSRNNSFTNRTGKNLYNQFNPSSTINPFLKKIINVLPDSMPMTPGRVAQSPIFSRMLANANANSQRDYEKADETEQIFSNFIGPMKNAIKRGRILQRMSMDPGFQGTDIKDIARWYDSLHDLYPDIAENYEAAKPLMKQFAAAGGMLPLSYEDMQKAMQSKMDREKDKKNIDIKSIIEGRSDSMRQQNLGLQNLGIQKITDRKNKRKEQLNEQDKKRKELTDKKDGRDNKDNRDKEISNMNKPIADILKKAKHELLDIDKIGDQLSDSSKINITNADSISKAIGLLEKFSKTPRDIKALSSRVSKMSKGGKYNSSKALSGLNRVADTAKNKVEGAYKGFIKNLHGQYKDFAMHMDTNNRSDVDTLFNSYIEPSLKVRGINNTLFSGVNELMSSPRPIDEVIGNINKKINDNFKKFG